MHRLLAKDNIDSKELETLLKARERGEVDFLLIDVRKVIEYKMGHIKHVDMLKPISKFEEWAEELFIKTKDKVVIFTCRSGHRSGNVQMMFRENGHSRVINHTGGILSYHGEIERG